MPHILTELPSDQAIITLRQVIIPSSFVAKISGVTLKASQGDVTLAHFQLGRGGWIIQAKANIQVDGGTPTGTQPLNVFWDLTADPGQEDTAHTVLGPTIVVFMVGAQVSTTGVVDLIAKNNGTVSALISNIVITGIKQDEVISLAM
jgi:hypothetical protein